MFCFNAKKKKTLPHDQRRGGAVEESPHCLTSKHFFIIYIYLFIYLFMLSNVQMQFILTFFIQLNQNSFES